ncbi:MAG: protein-disulfide reductase DsbD [Epsilonproteobacteria bacterium]|nr:protein-disulfide reductase DsbD [Campylobacterota bacterium]
MKILKLLLLVTLFLNAGFESALKGQSKFLSPQEAFKVSVIEDGDMLKTKIVLADKVHISNESLKYKIVKPKEFELNVTRPKPHKLNGDMVYEKEIAVNIPISDIMSKVKGSYTLMIEFQGCADAGICYNTEKKLYKLETPKPSFWDRIKNLANSSSSGNISDALSHENPVFIVALFFILGLLLALTPCIFPMIPILSSIIVSQSGSGKPSAAKGFFTSLIYVLSMAITYTAVGVISGLIGADIQAAMQNPWVLGTFALMFFALAISLFGYYEIQLPASWQSKINSASDNAQGKGIIGTAIMGFLSAFIIGPCVAPPLAGAVLFISKTGDAMLGGIALFTMSIGMGLPLLLVGIGAGKFMPKPGGWMTRVSQVFGVVMLALAIFMLSKVVPAWVTTLLWSLLFMGSAIYMGVFDNSSETLGMAKLFKLLSFVFLIYGASLFIALLSGSTSMLHPFEKFTTPQQVVTLNSSSDKNATSSSVDNIKITPKMGYSVERLMKEVKASKKPVIVDFNKQSCPSCRELEEITFPNPAVKKEMDRFKFISVDITKYTDDDKELLNKFGLWGTPNIIFFDSKHNYVKDETITGFLKPEPFLEHLKRIK